jgi:RNA recognition motif-containing protein
MSRQQPDSYLHEFVTGGNRERCVRLRGLPFSSSVVDIVQFFNKNGFNIIDSDVCMEVKGGRPQGRALVQLPDDRLAQRAARELHRQYIGPRYIEVDMLTHVEQEIYNY